MTILKGVVSKCGVMDKTVTVLVSRKVTHPILLKELTKHKKYLVHDEEAKAKLSDHVTIKLGRPVSKRKSFHLVSVDSRDNNIPADLSKSPEHVAHTSAASIPSGQAVQRALMEHRQQREKEALRKLGVEV
ncbi:hypothetical protein QFC22_000246 [Naganishia vaughanmartiniae]|uniref:Uncharacterized protein n=1 Tax=Naganishia vaughanmartiniae TaxID=1424756 RepID=A0ACC2XMK5_9TREE|nr:hypothetical protein QFC22_000246 [Naganishia vaughanmartiniae]